MKTQLTQKELDFISKNIKLTTHAKERLKERLNIEDINTLKKMIKHSSLAWNNNDNTICIVISNPYYLVVGKKDNTYIIITIKEKSQNNVTPEEKFVMAFFGHKTKK